MERKFGCIPDRESDRQSAMKFSASFVGLPEKPKLPTEVDNLIYQSPVEDQGNEGSCTGHGVTGAMESLEIVQYGTFLHLSRQFAYRGGRVREGTVNEDSGAMICDVVHAATDVGICVEEAFPYVAGEYAKEPSALAIEEAGNHRLKKSARCTSVDDMRITLAAKHPVVIGMRLYESFMSAAVAKSGVIPIPSSHEAVMGGHCMSLSGYSDTYRIFRTKNSWAATWGKHGYCDIPYDLFQYMMDCHALSLMDM